MSSECAKSSSSTEAIKAEPCPVCGSYPKEVSVLVTSGNRAYGVGCNERVEDDKIYHLHHIIFYADTQEACIEGWNKLACKNKSKANND